MSRIASIRALLAVGVAAVLAVFALAGPASAATYRVHRGDTLGRIAHRRHTSVRWLLRHNRRIRHRNVIRVGWRLDVPGHRARHHRAHHARHHVAHGRELQALALARTKVGHPYVYGATGPYAFDCSGLVQWAYRHAGYRRMPRTAQAQYRFTRRIPLHDLHRGDLIFDHSASGYVFHVSVYAGRGHVIEAASPSRGVRRAPVWRVRRTAGTLR